MGVGLCSGSIWLLVLLHSVNEVNKNLYSQADKAVVK